MKSIFLSFLFFFPSLLFSQTDSRFESIGKNTSELLIKREKIDQSKFALQLKKLYPGEDFSNFKDSPAEFILGMLHHSELELPVTWNELITQINDFGIDPNSKFYKTYFHKTGVDTYIVTSVIKSKSTYIIFSYNLLEWEKDLYISRFYKELKKFDTIEETEANLFTIVKEEMEKELKNLEETEDIIFFPTSNE